jgi:hypothetical protein
MTKKWKRWSILISLTAAFFMFVLALTSCGLVETASDGLTNSVGSENGPGSGKWLPPKPKNIRQARQLHNILQTLANNGNELSTSYDKLYAECFDVVGKLLPGKDDAECTLKAYELTKRLKYHISDFVAGADNYNTWAQESEEEDPPKAPDPPKEPKNPPKKDPETEDPEDDDDWGCCWCLTCINRIDLEYMYAPFRAELN